MKKITKDQEKRMQGAVAHLQEYISTYTDQPGYQRMSDQTWIDDVLYGLGVSLGKEYQFADGFRKFRALLKEHLEKGGA